MNKNLKKSFLSILLLAFPLALFAGPGATSNELSRIVQSKSGRLELKLELLESPAIAGEAVWIQLTVRNVRKDRIFFWSPNVLKGYQVSLFYPTGKKVPLTEHGKKQVPRPMDPDLSVHLNPGETDSYQINVASLYDCSEDGTYSLDIYHKGEHASDALEITGFKFELQPRYRKPSLERPIRER